MFGGAPLYLCDGRLKSVKVTTERLEGSRVGFDMVFEQAEVDKAMDKVYRRLVNKVNVPGFRPGKAPRYMVERVLGREAMMEDALNDILPDALKQALTENADLELIGEPEPDVVSLDPLTVRLVMDVMPTAELPADYRNIRVAVESVSVSDEELNRNLAMLQGQQTKWRFPEPERAAQLGDRAHVDIQGFTSAGPLTDKVQHDVLDLNPAEEGGNVLPALLEGVLGMKPGDDKDIATTFPEDYGNEALRGADVTFHVKLVELQEPEHRPSLDEVAQQEGDADAAALRDRIRGEITKQREERARTKQLDEILRQLNEQVKIDIPQALVQDGIERRVKELEERLSQQKIKLTQYLGYLGKTRSELEEEYRPEVERDTKTSLVVQSFAQREDITVSDEEAHAEAEHTIEMAIKTTLEREDIDMAADANDTTAAIASEMIADDGTAAEANSDSASADREEQANAIRARLMPMLDEDEFLDGIRTRLLNHKIEERLLAIANGEEPPLPANSGGEATTDSSEKSEAHGNDEASNDTNAEGTALTPTALAEQQQTAGASQVDGTQEAPAASDSPALDPTNAPTSAQTDRAKEQNPL